MCSLGNPVRLRFRRWISVVGLAEGNLWRSNLFECTVVHVWYASCALLLILALLQLVPHN